MEGVYHDQMTARYALQKSLNNATIGLAAMVGFDQVAALARDAGIKNARGTPSVAIGSYDATPLDMAGAYTIFANGGVHLDPWMLASVRTPTGDIVNDYTPSSRQVLDPRVAYLATDMMENVIDGMVRQRASACAGFTAPAAGKTGTEHDAWFAGFTSNLLCIVWVGNDDYTDLKLEGAHAAAPIWAEFMKKAVLLPQYSDTNQFTPPDGVEIVKLDKNTNLLATRHARTILTPHSSTALRPRCLAIILPITATSSKRFSAWARTGTNYLRSRSLGTYHRGPLACDRADT